jgi:hypothetical protein
VFLRGVVSAVDMYALAKHSPLIVSTSPLSAEYLRFLCLLLTSISPVISNLPAIGGRSPRSEDHPFRQSKPCHRIHGSLRNYLVYLPPARTVKKGAGIVTGGGKVIHPRAVASRTPCASPTGSAVFDTPTRIYFFSGSSLADRLCDWKESPFGDMGSLMFSSLFVPLLPNFFASIAGVFALCDCPTLTIRIRTVDGTRKREVRLFPPNRGPRCGPPISVFPD